MCAIIWLHNFISPSEILCSMKGISLTSKEITRLLDWFYNFSFLTPTYENFSFSTLLCCEAVMCISRVRLFAACRAPLSMEFSRQEHWSGVPSSTPEDLPDPGIKPVSLASPAPVGRVLPTSAPWEAHLSVQCIHMCF